LRRKSGQVFPAGHSVHWPRRLDGNGRTHCHFRSRHLSWWKAKGHYQANRAAVSSALVIFDLSSANVDTRLCGVAKKTLTAITKHRILSFLVLRRTQRFEEYGRGSSTE
jgi:hypothetical protein